MSLNCVRKLNDPETFWKFVFATLISRVICNWSTSWGLIKDEATLENLDGLSLSIKRS